MRTDGRPTTFLRQHLIRLLGLALALTPAIAAGPTEAPAADRPAWEAGVQGGASINSDDESFTQYEVLLNRRLPWSWRWRGAVDVGTRATGTLGILRGGGDAGLIGTLGFGFVFGDGHDLTVRAGSALTAMSEDEYGDEDFGSHLQFTHHVGLSYRLWDDLSARVRVQHMSNAGLASENPGLNLVMLGLHYTF